MEAGQTHHPPTQSDAERDALEETRRQLALLERRIEVEEALERVRARAMAMHQSEELIDIVQIVQDQLINLGLSVKTSAFDLVNQEAGTVTHWTTDWTWQGVSDRMEGLSVPLDKEGLVWQSRQAALAQEMAYNVTEISAATLKDFITFAADVFGAPSAWKDLSLEALPDRYFFNTAIISQGLLVTHSSVPYSDEHLQILVRFARVFEQAYIRFLDLKRAEEQAREAQIEAALERVRARAMAMHHSDELAEAAELLYQELVALGITLWSSGYVFLDEETEQGLVLAVDTKPDGTFSLAPSWHVPSTEDPVLQERYASWKRREALLRVELEGDANVEHNRYIARFTPVPEEEILAALPERAIYYTANFSHGYLFAITTEPMTAEDEQTLVRFAKVFEQTYTRFLDLKQAEAQAREAQIEAALERVRARAMGMHQSDELREVITAIFEQLQGLGIDSSWCAIGIYDADTRASDWWQADAEGAHPKQYHVPYLDGLWFKNAFKAWQQQVPYSTFVLSGEEKKQTEHLFYTGTDYKDMPEESYAELAALDRMVFSHACLKHGLLEVVGTEELPEGKVNIIQRFARVIDLTYTRFDDLQNAEARAREAVRAASLDRVRAEIASMRTAADLRRITPLVWRELTTLGVPFFRCGVFIIDEDAQTIHTYLSTPDGTSLTVFHLPFDSTPLVQETVAHWRRRQVYTDLWDGQQFAAWVAALVEQGHLNATDAYQGGEAPPASLAVHFLPFTQGVLYVGSSAPLSDEEIALGQALADAFSVAYARYEDFTRLEAAKIKIEATLTDLKNTQAQLIQAEKMASLGQLTAGIAHEIKNPLNFVNNFAEVNEELADELREDLADYPEALAAVEALLADLKQNAGVIAQHGKRADAIVHAMMQHASGGTGQREPTDLNALVSEHIDLAYHGKRAQVPDLKVEVERDLGADVGNVEVVPQEIGRVLLNLLGNAFDAVHEHASNVNGPYEPSVTVSTCQVEEKVEIRVSDNGPGIPEEIKDRIFEPFFTTKSTGSGTGLGLSLSYDIVTQGHGGTLTVESIDGQGATFIVTLPMNSTETASSA